MPIEKRNGFYGMYKNIVLTSPEERHAFMAGFKNSNQTALDALMDVDLSIRNIVIYFHTEGSGSITVTASKPVISSNEARIKIDRHTPTTLLTGDMAYYAFAYSVDKNLEHIVFEVGSNTTSVIIKPRTDNDKASLNELDYYGKQVYFAEQQILGTWSVHRNYANEFPAYPADAPFAYYRFDEDGTASIEYTNETYMNETMRYGVDRYGSELSIGKTKYVDYFIDRYGCRYVGRYATDNTLVEIYHFCRAGLQSYKGVNEELPKNKLGHYGENVVLADLNKTLVGNWRLVNTGIPVNSGFDIAPNMS